METKPICRTKKDGRKYWYLNGLYHREDGPAIVYPSGIKKWLINGKFHREDGPALEYGEEKYWFLNDKEYSEEFNYLTQKK